MTEAATRALTTTRQKSAILRDVLEKRRLEIQAALPRHITADKMLRLAMTACTKNPKLLECSPASVYGAVLQAAQLGLEPDLLGQAYLVPYFNRKAGGLECQLIPGYQGLMTLARRSGEIASIEARIVREGDQFSYSFGLEPSLVHRPDPEAAGPMTHVYAIARLRNTPEGFPPPFEVMTKAQVNTHRDRSKAKDSGPWKTDYEAMSLKTAVRRLCKFLPSSVELKTAVELDERADVGLPQDLPTIDVAPVDDESQDGLENVDESAATCSVDRPGASGDDPQGADSSVSSDASGDLDAERKVCDEQVPGAPDGFGCGEAPGHIGPHMP